MKIAVIGPGGIGSTFAFHLAEGGHDVTVVARGKRLEQLLLDRAIVTTDGRRAPIEPTAALDATTVWDLVLVTTLASQVDAVLPAVAASAARSVMFMFNTFEPLARLRDAVGPARFTFGFPAIVASVEDGRLASAIVTRGMLTTVSDPAWASVFRSVGIPTTVDTDMESWLRSHAALIVPFLIASGRSYTRRVGISWKEAGELARAMHEGFALVRSLGSPVTPPLVRRLSGMPRVVLTALLWTACRVPAVRKSGAAGPGEARTLIDAMVAAAPGPMPALLGVRP